MKCIAILLVCLGSLVTVSSSLAHHSAAAFDTSSEVTIQGEVVKYSFRNPHVYLEVAVTDNDGSRRVVEVEAGAGSVIGPLGFERDAISVGDIVTVFGNPGRTKPDTLLLGRELYRQDGTYFPLHIRSRSNYTAADAVASSIEGNWFASRASFYAYLDASESWPLTPLGQSAMGSLDPKATPQKDCVPLTSPSLLLYPVATTVTIHEDRVVLDIDWLDSERVIWLDGREHPPASEQFLHGHSVGHFEGDILVIDTTNFTDHLMGLSFFMPGSDQKHLTERMALDPDGTTISYSGTLSDPVYLSEPITWSGQWFYRPDLQHSNEACDLEVSQRFLDD